MKTARSIIFENLKRFASYFMLIAPILSSPACSSISHKDKSDKSLEGIVANGPPSKQQSPSPNEHLKILAYLGGSLLISAVAHEGGHLLAHKLLGEHAYVRSIFYFADYNDDGTPDNFYLVRMNTTSDLNHQEKMISALAGPSTNYLLGEITDELIKYRVITGAAEQPAAIFALTNKAAVYWNMVLGFFLWNQDTHRAVDYMVGFNRHEWHPLFYISATALDLLVNFKDYNNLGETAFGEPYHAEDREEKRVSYSILPIENGAYAGLAIKW